MKGTGVLRASLNVRLSKAASETNLSLNGMVDDLRELCRREGFREVALHVDDGVSGAVRDRPGLVRWLDDGRQGRADVLVAWHVDRMTREGLPVAAAILDVIEGTDPATGRPAHPPVRLMDYHGLDSRDGEAFRLRFVIQAEIARAARGRMADRSKRTAERLRRAGRWAGGSPPYGYRVVPHPDGAGKALDVDPAEAEVILEAANMVLAGHGPARVARWLNQQGHPSRRGSRWWRGTVTQVLTGHAVTGGVTIGGQPARDADGKMLFPFPAVLDLPTVLALRATLAPTGKHTPAGRAPTRLLSGLITCGTCGCRLNVYDKGAGAPVAYRCNSGASGVSCARQVTIAAERVEEFVSREFLTAFGRLPVTRESVTVVGAADMALLDDQITATLAELATNATADAFTRLQGLQAARAEKERVPRETIIERVPTGLTTAEEWERRDIEGRREMLTGAIAVLAVNRGRPTGRRYFDPSRVTLQWAEGEHDPE
jgi:DNA invertase Pin-like site-specific DNA recombinase